MKKFGPYIEELPFTILTDHASLKWLMSQKELSGRLARWSLKLQSFQFDIQHRKGAQNIVPDTLSRVYMEEIVSSNRILDVDLQSPFFKSVEYETLKNSIVVNKGKLPDIYVSDDYVYKRTKFATGDPVDEDNSWKMWIPKELQDGIITSAHASPSSGHGGIHKTLSRIREKYYWPHMASDVQRIIRKCEVCNVSKRTNAFRKTIMGKQFLTERPFQRLYIDFMGPYPRPKWETHSYSYILIILRNTFHLNPCVQPLLLML